MSVRSGFTCNGCLNVPINKQYKGDLKFKYLDLSLKLCKAVHQIHVDFLRNHYSPSIILYRIHILFGRSVLKTTK